MQMILLVLHPVEEGANSEVTLIESKFDTEEGSIITVGDKCYRVCARRPISEMEQEFLRENEFGHVSVAITLEAHPVSS